MPRKLEVNSLELAISAMVCCCKTSPRDELSPESISSNAPFKLLQYLQITTPLCYKPGHTRCIIGGVAEIVLVRQRKVCARGRHINSMMTCRKRRKCIQISNINLECDDAGVTKVRWYTRESKPVMSYLQGHTSIYNINRSKLLEKQIRVALNSRIRKVAANHKR